MKFKFQQPLTAKSITFLIASEEKTNATREPLFFGKRTSVLLESSDDGVLFKTVTSINTGIESELTLGYKFITYDLPYTRASYFRLTAYAARRISQVRFSSITRLANFMEKTGNRFQFYGEETSPIYTEVKDQVALASTIDPATIIDITHFINDKGLLQWNAPQGDWTILRFGYTPIGAVNKAAPDGGIGLECDKFSKEAVTFHFNKMLEPLLDTLKEITKNGNVGLEIDSYEAGTQSWSHQFAADFEANRNYKITNYLPALTGRIVQSTEHTERFLWDYRRTQADLIANNYYGQFTTLCHQHNFTSYIEPYDKGPFEEMQIGSRADVVMGEYWNGLFSILQGNLPIRRTPKLAASIAHTWGKRITALEAFTSEPQSGAWQMYPFALKGTGDLLFTKGINKLIIHRFAHQPHPTAMPGMTMGPWGIHFDRTNTWWEESAAWIQYTARCQFLLQLGFFVADLAYFTGEEANIYTRVNRDEITPAPPQGYDYDLINSEAILQRVTIKNNSLALPDGMQYKVLVLQNYKAISLEVLQKIRELVREGMVVVGAKPQQSLGLRNYADKDALFTEIVDELWKNEDGDTVVKNNVGNGHVYWGASLQNVLHELKIKPDLTFRSRSGNAPVHYIHRVIGKDHFYFIANNRRTTEDVICTFRVQNLQPELWNPIDGSVTTIMIYDVVENGIAVPLTFNPYGSLF
ncbi:MAG TPA: glycosyl hydrolase, partial [Chitinophagaceae bacterium]|nr:glycosyl hydrolase [Chitinophagaceae bacterium]